MRVLRKDVEIVQIEFSNFRQKKEPGSFAMLKALESLEIRIITRLKRECVEICPRCRAQRGLHYEGCKTKEVIP